MRMKWNIVVGLLLIALGAFFFLDGVFGWRANFGDFLEFSWPFVLILLGAYLLRRSWRARRHSSDDRLWTKVFGDITIEEDELGPGGIDTELGIGDIRINLTRSSIPDGEHRLRVLAGIGDVTIIIPQGIPVAARGSAGIGKVILFDKTNDGLGARLAFESKQYREARRKLLIEVKAGIGDIVLTRSET